ncbi:MAG: hypothetical protein DMF76_16930 [Acidobacteria bacterium]|nr:MAG: hypothetical protein DMF76_16930 [Acidobacteriota bacterium]
MKIQRIAIGLTVVNLLLLLFLLAQIHRTTAQDVVPVLRGRALEIVDGQGRVRAEILVHGPERVGGKLYPETVLFRMADQNRRPVVKFTAAENGSALGLFDDSQGRVQLNAESDTGNFVKVVNKDGREQVLKP